MTHRSDWRILEPAFAAGSASDVVERPFVGRPMLAVNPPGA